MNIRFMAGEMARLHNISKQTLIYYDRIGLFRPEETDEETGYRYYGLGQCEDLDVILCLKSFGMPLKEIKEYLRKTTIRERVCLLEDREGVMQKKIEEIRKAKNRLERTIFSLKKRMDIVPFAMGIKREKERFVVSRKVAAPCDQYQLEVAITHLFQDNREREDTGIHELLVCVKSDSTGGSLFTTVALQVEGITEESFPEMDYGFFIHQGSLQSLDVSRRKLTTFIESSGYTVASPVSIEKILFDALAVSGSDEYLIEIQIPVMAKS